MGAAAAQDFLIDPTEDAVPLFEFWRPSRDWVNANLFRLLDAGISTSVLREGDACRGAVLIVLADRSGACRLFEHVRSPRGHSQWLPLHEAEKLSKRSSEAALHLATRRDPDLWVLLIDETDFLVQLARERGAVTEPDVPQTRYRVPEAVLLRAASVLRSQLG